MTPKTRIEPLPPERAGLLTRAMYRIAKRRYGQVPEPFTVAAHHRGLMVAGAVHETMVERASRILPVSVRELAVYWTARRIGCSWCVDFGSMLQRLDGLDIQRLADIGNYATSPHFTDDERAAIAYADAVTTDPHTVTDEQVDDLRVRFGDAGVIELTYQIGIENMRARMNSALGITEQGFNSGDSCRIPWAASGDRGRGAADVKRAERGHGTTLGYESAAAIAVREVGIPTEECDIPATLYTLAELPEPSGLLVYYHGGGFSVGSRMSHDPVARLPGQPRRCARAVNRVPARARAQIPGRGPRRDRGFRIRARSCHGFGCRSGPHRCRK